MKEETDSEFLRRKAAEFSDQLDFIVSRLELTRCRMKAQHEFFGTILGRLGIAPTTLQAEFQSFYQSYREEFLRHWADEDPRLASVMKQVADEIEP